MDLNPDFKDMLVALNDAEIDYLVVGAYAVAVHGFPRATGDLDIWVRADKVTAPKIIRALTVFGAPTDTLSESEFATPSIVFQIGVPPGRIDVLTVITGVEFDIAWQNRTLIRIGELEFFVIGRRELIANKRATGRPKDIADLFGLGEEGHG